MMKRSLFFFCLWIVIVSFQGNPYDKARRTMIEEDLKGRNIRDTCVLTAMEKVPRHLFVPPEYKEQAYADHPLPIGEGQTISQPYIVALMSQELHLKPDDKVLEIGTGSGYQAAVLAELVKNVYTIEIIPELAEESGARLQSLGYKNIMVKAGDGYQGWKEYAPYDAIIITASAPRIPEPLIDQLKEGGRMILPRGGSSFYQTLILVTKKQGKIDTRTITEVLFVPMTGEIRKEK